MKNLYSFYLTIICAAFLLPIGATAQSSSGGSFTLEQTVIAGGGATDSTGGNFKIEGTIGQAAAGTRLNTSPFNLQNGFWTSAPLTPTSANVEIGGRITAANGRGIRNVFITLTNANGTSRTALSGSFGYYRFEEIESGQTLVINVRAKRFSFPQPTIVLNVTENITEMNFTAIE